MGTEMLNEEFTQSDQIQVLEFLLKFRRSCNWVNIP